MAKANLNHHLERNCSVLRTLPLCAKHMVTDPHDQEKEVRRVKKALILKVILNGYSSSSPRKTRNGKGQTTIDEETSPLVYRTLEVLLVAFRQLGVDLQHKPNINIRQLLMHVR